VGEEVKQQRRIRIGNCAGLKPAMGASRRNLIIEQALDFRRRYGQSWPRMHNRSSKPDKEKGLDVKEMAHSVAEIVAWEADAHPDKNPAAVALGRLGGKKGGPARARKLSKERRSEIASFAARSRWTRA
jgi:hypothetical protein